jgi:hypothetical protein
MGNGRPGVDEDDGSNTGGRVSVVANKRPGSMDTIKGKREKKTKSKTVMNRDKGLGVCGNN